MRCSSHLVIPACSEYRAMTRLTMQLFFASAHILLLHIFNPEPLLSLSRLTRVVEPVESSHQTLWEKLPFRAMIQQVFWHIMPGISCSQQRWPSSRDSCRIVESSQRCISCPVRLILGWKGDRQLWSMRYTARMVRKSIFCRTDAETVYVNTRERAVD